MKRNTEKKPFLSIITVTKNNISGLQKTHKSIKNQTLKNFEWWVIDGASDDGTKDWLQTVNTNFLHEPDNGIFDAMNKGIERAAGQYLLFLNAGDQLAAEDTLENIFKNTKCRMPDFIYADSYEDNVLKKAKSHTQISRGMVTHHQAMLYHSAKLESLRYDLEYKIAADYDFTIKFIRMAKTHQHLPFPICIFETGGISQTQANFGRAEEHKIRKTLNIGTPLSRACTLMRQRLAHFIKVNLPNLYRIMR